MRSLCILSVAVLACLAALPLAASQGRRGDEKKPSQDKTPLKAYFIGHSLYDCGNVPAAVQYMSEHADVDRPIKATVYTRGGATHQNHWETPEVMKRLREEPWDVVLIAGNCNDMSDPAKVNLDYAVKLDNEVKKRNIRVLEYLAWPWVKVTGDNVFEKRAKAQEAFNQPLDPAGQGDGRHADAVWPGPGQRHQEGPQVPG